MELKGRPIGLHASMNKEAMKKHLERVSQEWQAEGFSESEVRNAILAKCHPLIVGFYWHRYPQASKTLAEVLRELGYPADYTPKRASSQPKVKPQVKPTSNLMEQFEAVM